MLGEVPAVWSRAVILRVQPAIDGGRWPIKRIAGETVTVTADIVADGHDLVAAEIRFGPHGDDLGTVRMATLGNDAYFGSFTVETPGRYTYQVRAWVDQYATWRDLFRRRIAGGSPAEEIASELREAPRRAGRGRRGSSGPQAASAPAIRRSRSIP